ncbi:MAG: DegV family protein [Longimicrobiales bacterium]|nr:DegV family protein [Longimicrobiales bacterium]
MQIRYIDGPRLRRSLVAACEYASGQRGELNRINVFPVPDGDTGTNLALTVRAVSDHLLRNRDRAVSAVAREAAQAAVLGARGNCGMILSHFLLGFSRELQDRVRISAAEFSEALQGGVRNLYGALERPVEGTILTVMRETAEAADRAAIPDFVPLVDHLVGQAREALARTPDLLPVLRSAGVVDAGAKGFVSLLEGVLLFIHGDPLTEVAEGTVGGGVDAAGAAGVAYPDDSERYRFCTEALVRGPALPSQDVVKRHLRELGDSLIAIRAGNVLKVHIHTDEPEAVFGYLRSVGTLATHKAEDMRAQHAAVERAGHVALARRPVGVFTDSAADLPEEVVRAHGIHVTPLVLIEGERSYRDGIDITATEFHSRLEGPAESLPTTSQPAPADFLRTFEAAAAESERLVGVTAGSTLTGTFQSAGTAARHFTGAPVAVMDSLGVSLLQGLLVLKAAELAELGTDPERIVAELERIRRRSNILFTVRTFDRLLASGRVGRGRAALGAMLNVKPVLGLSPEGRVLPFGKAIGSRRVTDLLLERVREGVGDAERVRFGVVHVALPEVVRPVSDALRGMFGEVEILVAPATPVIATHIGPGAWGVAYMVED